MRACDVECRGGYANALKSRGKCHMIDSHNSSDCALFANYVVLGGSCQT